MSDESQSIISWIVTVNSACNGELTDNGFDFAEKRNNSMKALVRIRVAPWESPRQVSVTGYKDLSVKGRQKRSCDLKTFVERHGA